MLSLTLLVDFYKNMSIRDDESELKVKDHFIYTFLNCHDIDIQWRAIRIVLYKTAKHYVISLPSDTILHFEL